MGESRAAQMTEDWKGSAQRELLRLRCGAAGWGYRIGTRPAAEPTALACLGLLGSLDGSQSDHPAIRAAVRQTAERLAGLQRPDGSLGISADHPKPGWATPYGILVWKVLALDEPRCVRAAAWLLRHKGKPIPREDDPDRIVGHDTTLIGWPWVDGTHSWLEPTALAILALGTEGFDDHPRVREGLNLIRDRAIPDGGWNYGNKSAFGRPLRPQPGPTGLALLALAAGTSRSEVVDRAIRYLEATLPGVRAAGSLGWGLLGLRAWGREPSDAAGWLAESHAQAVGRPDAAPRLAHLLLASGRNSLELFGRGNRND
jgi:hypothetical protein